MNIYDIAKKANVSVATVSRVINGSDLVSTKTKKKIEKIIEESGYIPNGIARSLATNKSQTVGIMVSNITRFYDYKLAYQLERSLTKIGYVSILCNTTVDLNQKINYLYLLREKKVDGIITIGSMYEEEGFIKELLKIPEQIPIIMLNAKLSSNKRNIVNIFCDDTIGIVKSIEYLHSKNYAYPMYIFDSEGKDTRGAKTKKIGFKKAMKKFYPDKELIEFEINNIKENIIDIVRIIKNKKIDAIQFEKDELAVKIFKYFTDLGINIPDEVAMVGFDNTDSTNYTQKTITSIDQRLDKQASQAIDSLVKMIKGEGVKNHISIDPTLIFKETT